MTWLWLKLGPAARPILRSEERLEIVLPPPKPRRERWRRNEAALGAEADPLFEALRARRRELAQAAAVPPYVIFHDSVLRAVAATRPRDLTALGSIGGVGAAKLERYGEAFLEVVRQHR